DRLVDAIWTDGGEYVDENALSVAANRLRRKLGGKTGTCPIQTIYGLGYMWTKEQRNG
ncbi:MAG: helix-turn-helix domain-containing protein, partial [Blautia sp.]|nr:helix-turn-helix domain-containing protein [Blautia sp.]